MKALVPTHTSTYLSSKNYREDQSGIRLFSKTISELVLNQSIKKRSHSNVIFVRPIFLKKDI